MRTFSLFLALFAAGVVQAQDNCTIDLQGSDQMKFDKQSVTVSAGCETITINLRHVGTMPEQSMGHNVVISPTACEFIVRVPLKPACGAGPEPLPRPDDGSAP